MVATPLDLEAARATRRALRALTITVGFGMLAWLACLAVVAAWAAPHLWRLLAAG